MRAGNMAGRPSVFSYEAEPTVDMTDWQSRLLNQRAGLLTAPLLTPWTPRGIKLAIVVLLGGDDVHILGSEALFEQLNVDVMES